MFAWSGTRQGTCGERGTVAARRAGRRACARRGAGRGESRGRDPRRCPQLGRSGPTRSGARLGRQRRGHPTTRRMGDGPRPPADIHLDRPGLRRLEVLEPRGRPAPGRSWRTAAPSTKPSRTCWLPPAAWSPASACCSARRGPAAPTSSTWRSTPWAGASISRSSRMNIRTPLPYRTAADILARLVESAGGGNPACRRAGATQPVRAHASRGDRLGDRSRARPPGSPGRRPPARTPSRRCLPRHLPAGGAVPVPRRPPVEAVLTDGVLTRVRERIAMRIPQCEDRRSASSVPYDCFDPSGIRNPLSGIESFTTSHSRTSVPAPSHHGDGADLAPLTTLCDTDGVHRKKNRDGPVRDVADFVQTRLSRPDSRGVDTTAMFDFRHRTDGDPGGARPDGIPGPGDGKHGLPGPPRRRAQRLVLPADLGTAGPRGSLLLKARK